MVQPNNADSLPSAQRIAELGEILAAGLQRAFARKSSGKNSEIGERSLDFSAIKSGDPTHINGRMSDD